MASRRSRNAAHVFFGRPCLQFNQPHDRAAAALAPPRNGAELVDDIRRQPDGHLAARYAFRLVADPGGMVARMASKAAVVMSMRIISEEFLPPYSALSTLKRPLNG